MSKVKLLDSGQDKRKHVRKQGWDNEGLDTDKEEEEESVEIEIERPRGQFLDAEGAGPSTSGEQTQVPVHLFVSPTHRPEAVMKETAFMSPTNETSDGEDGSSGVTSSNVSSPSHLTHPTKRSNRIRHLDTSAKSAIREKGEAEAGRSITSISDYASDHFSFREKLRDHFNTLRERAVESLSRPQSRSQSRMKVLLAGRTPNRAEDVLKREERDISVALQKHEQLRGHWRQLSHQLITQKLEKEGNDFFTQEGSGEENASEAKLIPHASDTSQQGSGEAADIEVLSSRSEENKQTALDCIGLRQDWEPAVWSAATILKSSETSAELIIFSAKPVPMEEKLESGLKPRFIDEEGFYLGPVIVTARRRNHKLERRLLQTPDGRKWFGSDGMLKCRGCPKVYLLDPILILSPSPMTVYQFPVLGTDTAATAALDAVLDLELVSIRFSHHSLFSREHVLAQKIRTLWRKYRLVRQLEPSRRLAGRLDALRRKDWPETHWQRFEREMINLRDKWFSESQSELELERCLLDTWRDIQRLREQQGFRNTGVQLVVTNKEPMASEQWNDLLTREQDWAIRLAKHNYQLQQQQFEEALEVWRRAVGSSSDEDKDDIVVVEQDVSPEEKTTAAPVPPPPLDENGIRRAVVESIEKSFRKPLEPEVEITIADLGAPSPATDDSKEEARRGAVGRHEIVVRLMYNGKEVCRSRCEPLTTRFAVKLQERLAVRLLEWPQSLSLELLDNARTLANVYLPFPDSGTVISEAVVESREFSSPMAISYTHAGVGSGKEVVPCPGGTPANSRPVRLYTSGTVHCRLGWAVDDSGKVLAPPAHFFNLARKYKLTWEEKAVEKKKLKEWADMAELDPNDPSNADVFDWLTEEDPKPSPPSTAEDDLLFCSDADLLNNPRLRLLRLRDQGEPEFRGYQMVPLHEKLIHPDLFKAYETRIARPVELDSSVDPLDNHRAIGRRRLDQIRQKVIHKCRQARQHRRLAHVVIEDQVPDLGTLGLTLMRWLRPKRPLRPERKQRKKVAVHNLVGQNVNIIVNVVRAFEVPVRTDMDSMAGQTNLEGFSLVNVRPFVSATFRGVTSRTTPAEGANPTWNQDLILPVRTSTGDFSPGVLSNMEDTLYIHLFDEVVVDLVEEEILRDTTVHQRIERHWLAGLEIPFSTLYCNSRVEGTFELYSPPVLLGYEREAHRQAGPGVLPQRDQTYLTLFITVQPALNPPEPFQDIISSSESIAVEKHLRGWWAEVNATFPGRAVSPLVTTGDTTAVCITRFLRPLTPPTSGAATPEAAARFVAMIPTIASATFYPGLLNVWLTCDQVVEMLRGAVEDHAVLLCCFLLDLGLPAYLLLGVGIPHGSTAYVLVADQGKETVWDPTTGRRFSVLDSFCPLQKVYCLVNSTNMWANIQDDDSPRRIRWDVNKRADWLPAFNKNMAPPEDSIQPASLTYKETSRQAVQALQEKMESRLRDSMMRWRQRQRTQWNRYCAATMRKYLPTLEEAVWNASQSASPQHWQGLSDILASHKVCGFPINMAYTDMEGVIAAVKATGVHLSDSENVEFALAVHIYPYPCNVLSVWVYVGSLTRRR